jgi:predicted  nucleic acid-binding Zn-ribbon protein
MQNNINEIEKKIAAAQEQLSILHRQRDAARLERAKSYADAFIRKLEANEIPLTIGTQALRDLSKIKGSKTTS